jgi:hypothetical protein
MNTLMFTVLLGSLLTTTIAVETHFKINGTDFIQKMDDGSWKTFGQFAGINLGITSPGKEPGQVILGYSDYMYRFRNLAVMGNNVVRVYSLLHPDFYKAVVDWNAEHSHTIYVLQGTAFPELAMDHNNGTDAYDSHITELMENYIINTVAGVYGGGNVLYKHTDAGQTEVYGDYRHDISKYLLGWVISGEISPMCINKTNNLNATHLREIVPYNGQYISSIPESSRFETWVAGMYDLLAKESIKYGQSAPISHTNWVTTDGIKHPVEPLLAAGEPYGEDWQEFDLHNFDFSKWQAGSFYNQHAYPYYPEFLKIEGRDSFINYIRNLRNFYNDKPLIITEIGLPTSIGISSADRIHGRNHGHNGEINQGELMTDLMIKILENTSGTANGTEYPSITGIIVFQLHDEWFKKSWNTLEYDQNRQRWKNALTSEQYFGIFEVLSHPELAIAEETAANKYYSAKITNNYEFVNIEIDIEDYYALEAGMQINIGIDMSPGGTNEIHDIGSFENNVDAYITITDTDVHFKISSEYDTFKNKYGLWLEPESFPTYKDDLIWKHVWEHDTAVRNECYKFGCQFLREYENIVSFDDFKLLVKTPTVGNWTDPDCKCRSYDGTPVSWDHDDCSQEGIMYTKSKINIYGLDKCYIDHEKNITEYHAQIYAVEFKEESKTLEHNLAMVKRIGNKIIINVPYQMLGFSDPSSHQKYFSTGLGNDHIVNLQEYRNDIKFEFYYSIGAQFEDSKLIVPFNWEDWSVPEYYMIRPKQSIHNLRNIFTKINTGSYPTNNLTQQDIDAMTYYSNIPGITEFQIHIYMVYGSLVFIIFSMLSASIGKFLIGYIGYCYSSRGVKIHSPRLAWINIIMAGLFIWILFNIKPTTSFISLYYFAWILLIIWDSLVILVVMIFVKWNLHEKNDRIFNSHDHAFIIACHNSSDVITDTLQSLLQKAEPQHIYVADNGSSEEEQFKTKQICEELSTIYGNGKEINYGHMALGNKTIAQYGSVCTLPDTVKYVTCIDDDTRLDDTWSVHKVIRYFEDDEDVVVLAYPLAVDKPEYDIEWFQAMEYIIVGYIKIFHSKVYSTIFNSGAFGTYRVPILKEAFLYHNTDYHGDDLQICMHIHQLKGKKFYNHPTKVHTQNYKVATATDMIVSTIVPKCWVHLSSISKCFANNCKCGNPDLFGQRSKGWFVSMHRFIPRYIKLIMNVNGINGGLWIRLIALYELIIIINEYFAIFYIIFFLKNYGIWLVEGFVIGYAFNIFVMTLFNWLTLRSKELYVPYEVITIQPLIYKIFMITIYRYLGLFYNLFVYSIKHKSGTPIIMRQNDEPFINAVRDMYPSNSEKNV